MSDLGMGRGAEFVLGTAQEMGALPWPTVPLSIALSAWGLYAAAAPHWPAVVWLALWSLADWLFLAALPWRGISYGTVQPSHLALLAVRWLIALGAARVGGVWGAALGAALQPCLMALAVYVFAVEPFRLGVSEADLCDAHASAGARPLSIVQISDLHVERLTRREESLLRLLERLQPDLILLTGDYLNLSYIGEERAVKELRAWLGRLHARYGVYAVRGTPEVDPRPLMPHLFTGLPITVLEARHVDLEIEGHRLRLVGVGCDRDLAADSAALHAALPAAGDARYTVLLYHMPDLLPVAAAAGVDLYLAGHTHGGQLRVPGYGALVTGSHYGKRYEMGWYREGGTRMYVSRGIGLEGLGAPRARFLCPPEVLHIRLL